MSRPMLFRLAGWILLCLAAATPILALSSPPVITNGGNPVFLDAAQFATGFSSATDVTNAGDTRLFVTEEAGRIKIVQDDGTVLGILFLDITDRVATGFQQGLLSLAFDPNYASNGYFYVYYTYEDSTPQLYTRLSRFSVTTDPDVADPTSELVLLSISQPFGDNNGGDLNFGDDGYLYLSVGDGGDFGDPNDNGQSTNTLLGKMLRLDVHGGGNPAECDPSGNYTIPATNPLADGAGGACDEIWAVGLRNPWRFSFDRSTGDMFVGDVGEFTREEISFTPTSSTGGENYGWRCWEGNQPGPNTTGCGPSTDYDMPIFDYPHGTNGCAVTGGYVYRGTDWPDLQGTYVFADFCSGNFWTLSEDGGGGWEPTLQGKILPPFSSPSSFGENNDGELFVVVYDNTEPRSLYRITLRPLQFSFLPLITAID